MNKTAFSHRLNASVLYDLPVGHGKKFSVSGSMDVAVGGWQIGGTLNVRSGLPIDVLITRPDVAYVGNIGTSIAGQVFASPVVTGGVVQTTAVVNTPGGGNSRNIRSPQRSTGTGLHDGNSVRSSCALKLPTSLLKCIDSPK